MQSSIDVQNIKNAKVIVHPLVLLSVVDHYNRVAKNTKKRVVGVLLGRVFGNVVNVTNSFAVPFEEEDKNNKVWFLDHNYVENMRDMFKKVNVKEVLIGWYHSGPKLQAADLQINELFKRYVANPVLVVVDVHPKEVGIPTNAYISIEEIHDDGSAATKTFEHIPSEIGAEEAEEIGVEHLLRDVKDNAIGTLSLRLARQLESIKGLNDRLEKMSVYLDNVVSGKLPVNVDIIYNLQDIFNLIPNLDAAKLSSVFAKKTNDTYMLLYISTMIRAIISLHDLVNNKIQNREAELAQDISQAPNQQNVQPTTPQTDTS